MFADFIAATPAPNPADAASILLGALESVPSLIVIDDYHKVSDNILHQTIKALSLALL